MAPRCLGVLAMLMPWLLGNTVTLHACTADNVPTQSYDSQQALSPKPSSPEPAADRGPSRRSSLVASLPSVAPRVRLPGGVSGGLMDRGEIMAPVVWFLKSLQ